MCVCVCVFTMWNLMNIFLLFSLRGCVIDRTTKLFNVPATKLHYQTGVCYSTSCLALNKIRGYFVAQYCPLCSVLSINMLYNDHHQFQWILLGISEKSVNVGDIFVGVGVHAVFFCCDLTYFTVVLMQIWGSRQILPVSNKNSSGSAVSIHCPCFVLNGPDRG